MGTLTVDNNKIRGRGLPQSAFATCRKLPGAWYADKTATWSWPATPASARAILAALISVNPECDENFQLLYRQAMRSKEAAAFRNREDLPDHPSQTISWLHQRQAYEFAIRQASCGLFMDMGTGKTKCAVDLIVNRGHKLVLVVVPKRALGVWPREFRMHAAQECVVSVLDGTFVERGRQMRETLESARAFNYERPTVIVTSYSTLSDPRASAVRLIIMQTKWDLVILDEAHRISSPGGKQSMFVAKLGDQVPYKLALTGTPLRNGPFSAYALYRFLDKGVFGTRFSGSYDRATGQFKPGFRERYAVMHPHIPGKVIEYVNLDELNEKIYSIGFRVTQEVLDLPPEVSIRQPVEMNTRARRAHSQMRKTFVSEGVLATNVLSKILRLQQITSGYLPARDDEEGEHAELQRIDTAKEDALEDLLTDLPPTEPVVVFVRFQEDIEAVKRVAERTRRRYGEVSGHRSDLTADAKMPENVDLLCVQIQAGGEGVDFTRARYGVFFSIGYSLSDYLQAKARIHRPGQTRETILYHFVATDSIDEDIMDAVEGKREIAEVVLERWTDGDDDGN